MMDAHSSHAPFSGTRRGARRADRAARRAERDARARLRRELASYTSSADQHDLDAILARHSDVETAQVRDLLCALNTAPVPLHTALVPVS